MGRTLQVPRSEADSPYAMLWFFTRACQQVDLEVRRSPEDATYELIVTSPDGSERSRTFSNPTRLVEYTLEVQRQLLSDGWMPGGVMGVTRPALPAPAGSEPDPATRAAVADALAGSRRHVFASLKRRIRRALAATFGF